MTRERLGSNTPPLLHGGQGRTSDDIEGTGVALLAYFVVLLVLAAVATTVWLLQ